jgi:hypothetical protein
MQVRLTTTVSTIIDLSEHGANIKEARREIFTRFNENIAEEDPTEDLKAAHSSAVVFDQIVGTEVTHSFEEVK